MPPQQPLSGLAFDYWKPIIIAVDGLSISLGFISNGMMVTFDLYSAFFPGVAWAPHGVTEEKAQNGGSIVDTSIKISIPYQRENYREVAIVSPVECKLWAFLSCVPRKGSCDFGELFLVTLRLFRGSLKALNKCDFVVIPPNLCCIIVSRRKTENNLEHKSLHSKIIYSIIIRKGSELI